MAELVHGGRAAHDHEVLKPHVARKRHVVGDDDVVAQLAVVGDVDVGHEEVARADARDGLILNGADRDRAVFADHVVVADFKGRVFARVLLVLGLAAHGGVLKDPVAAADAGAAGDRHVAVEHGARADHDVGTDDAERSDLDVIG